MASKELFTVHISIDTEVIVEAESLEEAGKLAEKEWCNELENVEINTRARPFTEFDLEDNEFGWTEDCCPLGGDSSLKEILQRRR